MTGLYLIFVPEINSSSFVLFNFKAEHSYSIREYDKPPLPKVRYSNEFPYSGTEIWRMANRIGSHRFTAERVRAEKFEFWQQRIHGLNETFLDSAGPEALSRPSPPAAPSQQLMKPRFPLLNEADLRNLPKASKREDMERILQSPNSEDYVTWNVFQLLRLYGGNWWSSWLDLARKKNPAASKSLEAADQPDVRLWRVVPSPRLYEQTSRQRMAASSNPDWVQRSLDPKPVEGPSEIDIVLSGKRYLIFVEAKLGSDIAVRTKYDPERNQIIRNIDCVIEACGDCVPSFWMIARDRLPGRSFMQALGTYKRETAALCSALGHRDKSLLEDIASRATVFSWRELLGLLPGRPDDLDAQRVLNELNRRI